MTSPTDPEACYLIRKRGLWYRPAECGYTTSAIQAGRYTREQAEAITHPNGPDGPRDDMSYLHEEDVQDEDLQAYRALAAEVAALRAERDRLHYVLEGVRGAIDTGRNEPLMIWRDQINIALTSPSRPDTPPPPGDTGA